VKQRRDINSETTFMMSTVKQRCKINVD